MASGEVRFDIPPYEDDIPCPPPRRFDELACRSRYDGYFCTRPTGHTGDHVAHGLEDQFIHGWGDAEADKKEGQ